jgi:uncharacterized membrane protein YhfC
MSFPAWEALWCAICVVSVVVCRTHGARSLAFFLGILSWILGVSVKVMLTVLLPRTASPVPLAIQDGFISALTELLAAVLFLWLLLRGRRPSSADAFAFGVGIGVFEGFFVWMEAEFTPVGGMFVLERTLTLIGHTASRFLIYSSLVRRRLLPALLATVLFAAVDGVASYGSSVGWDWTSPLVLARFYSFIAGIGVVEVLAARYFAPPRDSPPDSS